MSSNRNESGTLILVVLIVTATMIVFWSFLDVVVLAMSLAVVLMPLHHYCKKHMRRGISAALVTITVFLIFIASLFFAISILSANSDTLREIINTITLWINNPATSPNVFGIPFDRTQVSGWLEASKTLYTSYLQTTINSLPPLLFKILVFFLSLHILLLYGEALKERVMMRVPGSLHGHMQKMCDVTVDTLYAIYIVQVAITAITFVAAIPFFYILGYGHVLFYSFLCAFCELIPVLGSAVVFIFMGTYAFSLGDIRGVLLLFFLGYIGISAFPELFIRPVLMGRRLHLNPLIMLVGFFGGVMTMGVVGFVLGPVIIVLFFTGLRIFLAERKSAQHPPECVPPP
jgi:predicted PurR-regulated permease PerM